MARWRVSLQVSTRNTKVFSYLICIHSHNEWACLSCFQVRRVQTRLLFTLSLDTCMLLPLVRALESSNEFSPEWMPPIPLLCCFLQIIKKKKCLSTVVDFFSVGSSVVSRIELCHPKSARSESRTHK